MIKYGTKLNQNHTTKQLINAILTTDGCGETLKKEILIKLLQKPKETLKLLGVSHT